MAEHKLEIGRMSDLEVAQALAAVATDCAAPKTKLNVRLAKDSRQFDVGLESIESDPILEPLFRENSGLIYQMHINLEQWGATVLMLRTTERSDTLQLNF